MENDIITDEEAVELEKKLAAYRNHKAIQAMIANDAVWEKLKPVVECDQFAEVHAMLVEAMDGVGPENLFSVHANALINIMPHLVNAVTNHAPYVPVTLPEAPEPEA